VFATADSRAYWRSLIRTLSGAIHLLGSDGRADDARAFARAERYAYAEAHAGSDRRAVAAPDTQAHAGSDRHSDAEAFAGSDTAADAATYACAVA